MIDAVKGEPIHLEFPTFDVATGLLVAPVGLTVAAFEKTAPSTPITAGLTLQVNGIGTGVHQVDIDSSNAAWERGRMYYLRATAGTAAGVPLALRPIDRFGIEYQYDGRLPILSGVNFAAAAVTLPGSTIGADGRQQGARVQELAAGQLRQLVETHAGANPSLIDRAWDVQPSNGGRAKLFPGSLEQTIAEFLVAFFAKSTYGYTFEQLCQLQLGELLGSVTGLVNGAGTGTLSKPDGTPQVVADFDTNGNKALPSSVTL